MRVLSIITKVLVALIATFLLYGYTGHQIYVDMGCPECNFYSDVVVPTNWLIGGSWVIIGIVWFAYYCNKYKKRSV